MPVPRVLLALFAIQRAHCRHASAEHEKPRAFLDGVDASRGIRALLPGRISSIRALLEI